jgi:hypothetical protein
LNIQRRVTCSSGSSQVTGKPYLAGLWKVSPWRLAIDPMTQGLTFQQFHGNEGAPVTSSISQIAQMLGWFRAEAARASRRNRSSACGSLASSAGRNLRATRRRNLRSSASYTTPKPRHQSCSACGSERRFARQVEAESTLPGMLRGSRGGVDQIGRPPVEAETGSITICSDG